MRAAHLEGQRAHGDHDPGSVSAHGETLVDLLHQGLDGNALRTRRINERGERLATWCIEPVAETRILRFGAPERGADEEYREETAGRSSAH